MEQITMQIQATLMLAGGLVASLLLVTPAKADVILPARCHMGICGENRFIQKDVLRTWPMEEEPSGSYNEPRTSYVYCSTSRPAIVFESDGIYYADLLNPGGDDFYGYNMSDYPVYWATCHNFVGPDFFSERMTANAIRLGYPLNLPQDQIELRNVLDIMN
jgi:hypothetical protein